MQDNDFDRLIREALENQAEPTYNPSDWDLLEDRLHQMQIQAPKANPSAGTSAGATGGGLAKLGFVASTVLFTAINAVNLIQPAIFENGTQTNSKTAIETSPVALNETESAGLAEETAVTPVAPAEQPVAETETKATDAAEKGNAVSGNQAAANKPANGARTKNKQVTKENTVFLNGSTFLEGATTGTTSQNGGNLAAKQGTAGNNALIACAGNTKPEITAILKGNDTLRTNRLSLYTCETLNLKLNARDKEADKISITSNVANVLPGAQLLVSENGTAQLQWNAKPEMARSQPYNFTLWLSDNRCPNSEPRAYQYALNVMPAFTASLNGATKIEPGQTAMLEVTGAPQGATYRWFGQDGKPNSWKNAYLSVSPKQTTTYKVQVVSQNGCMFTDSAKVEVMLPQAVIPNIVTPNNDGKNDFFEVNMPTDEPVRLEIFDQRSRQVYVRDNYNNSWNADGLPAGTYNYLLRQGDRTYKGWVEVIR
jgi:gliding motility-associated-like protein